MNQTIELLLEDNQGNLNPAKCDRFAIILEGKEVWVQNINGQLFIGTDVGDTDTEFTNLVLRPLATNLVSLQLEIEPMEEGLEEDDDGCCGGHSCGCEH